MQPHKTLNFSVTPTIPNLNKHKKEEFRKRSDEEERAYLNRGIESRGVDLIEIGGHRD